MFIAKLIPSRLYDSQARRPTGIIGRYVMAKLFNDVNADLNTFVKQTLDVQKSDRVLEIGFGPGRLIRDLADITTDGIVEGVDFSKTMFKQASKVNRQHISRGRVRLHNVECSDMPVGDESFSKLCSVNTLYFWNEPEQCQDEMFRVTKKGGKVVIGFRDDKQMSHLKLSEDIFRLYSQGDVLRLLSESGFSDSHIREQDGVPFVSYCAVATKA